MTKHKNLNKRNTRKERNRKESHLNNTVKQVYNQVKDSINNNKNTNSNSIVNRLRINKTKLKKAIEHITRNYTSTRFQNLLIRIFLSNEINKNNENNKKQGVSGSRKINEKRYLAIRNHDILKICDDIVLSKANAITDANLIDKKLLFSNSALNTTDEDLKNFKVTSSNKTEYIASFQNTNIKTITIEHIKKLDFDVVSQMLSNKDNDNSNKSAISNKIKGDIKNDACTKKIKALDDTVVLEKSKIILPRISFKVVKVSNTNDYFYFLKNYKTTTTVSARKFLKKKRSKGKSNHSSSSSNSHPDTNNSYSSYDSDLIEVNRLLSNNNNNHTNKHHSNKTKYCFNSDSKKTRVIKASSPIIKKKFNNSICYFSNKQNIAKMKTNTIANDKQSHNDNINNNNTNKKKHLNNISLSLIEEKVTEDNNKDKTRNNNNNNNNHITDSSITESRERSSNSSAIVFSSNSSSSSPKKHGLLRKHIIGKFDNFLHQSMYLANKLSPLYTTPPNFDFQEFYKYLHQSIKNFIRSAKSTHSNSELINLNAQSSNYVKLFLDMLEYYKTMEREEERTKKINDICIYHYIDANGDEKSLEINSKDFGCLESTCYLNDAIVNFYLEYLINNKKGINKDYNKNCFNDECKEQCKNEDKEECKEDCKNTTNNSQVVSQAPLCFMNSTIKNSNWYDKSLNNDHKSALKFFNYNSLFYSTIISKSDISVYDIFEEFSGFNDKQIKNWKKAYNKFSFDFWIIPVCSSYHWYSLVVVNPSKMKNVLIEYKKIIDNKKSFSTVKEDVDMIYKKIFSKEEEIYIDNNGKSVENKEENNNNIKFNYDIKDIKDDILNNKENILNNEDSVNYHQNNECSTSKADILEDVKLVVFEILNKLDDKNIIDNNLSINNDKKLPSDSINNSDTSQLNVGVQINNDKEVIINYKDCNKSIKRVESEISDKINKSFKSYKSTINSVFSKTNILDKEYPTIIYLDSLYTSESKSEVVIRKYLYSEFIDKLKLNKISFSKEEIIDNFTTESEYKNFLSELSVMDFMLKTLHLVPCHYPNSPKQPNSYDCGIYLLEYIETLITKTEFFLKEINFKFKEANITNEECGTKRKDIQNIILNIASRNTINKNSDVK